MNIQCLSVSSALLLGCLGSSAHGQCSPTELDKYAAFNTENHTSGQFGRSLAVSGDKMVVGASGLNSTRGRVFFYSGDGDQWLPHSSFRAIGDGSGDTVGYSVAIDGDIMVAGAPGDDDLGYNAGAAYIFRYDGTNWNQETKLLASDGVAGDLFGASAAISGNVIVLGVEHQEYSTPEGAAYVFRYDGANWVEEAKLLASDGGIVDRFGTSVAIEGNTILVGAPDHNAGNWGGFGRYGSAYIFQYDGANWAASDKLFGPDEVTGNLASSSFGVSVAISGGRMAVGNHLDPDGQGAGAVFIYGTDGQIQQKIQGTVSIDSFGKYLALTDDTLVVSAPTDQGFQGAVYLYNYDGSAWIGTPKIVSSDIDPADSFGSALAISGDTILIGASADDDQATNSGAFYVFDQGCAAGCPADLTGNGTLNFFDISAFLTAFSAQDPVADFDGNGTFNFFDISAFLSAFSAGCP